MLPEIFAPMLRIWASTRCHLICLPTHESWVSYATRLYELWVLTTVRGLGLVRRLSTPRFDLQPVHFPGRYGLLGRRRRKDAVIPYSTGLPHWAQTCSAAPHWVEPDSGQQLRVSGLRS